MRAERTKALCGESWARERGTQNFSMSHNTSCYFSHNMAQAELASEADFDRLLQTSSKYVVIFAYEFEVPSMARE